MRNEERGEESIPLGRMDHISSGHQKVILFLITAIDRRSFPRTAVNLYAGCVCVFSSLRSDYTAE